MKNFVIVFPLLSILGNIIFLDRWSVILCTSFDNSEARSHTNCSSVSQIADLIGFANLNINGFPYAFLNFNLDDVVAVVSYSYDFQPGIVYNVRIINVVGFLVQILFSKNGKKRGPVLFYIDLDKDGPRITSVPQSGTLPVAEAGALDGRLPGSSVDIQFSYLLFKMVLANVYNGECNQFTRGTGDYPCSCQSPYIFRSPIETVSLARCRTVINAYLTSENDNATGAGDYIDAYGLSCLQCTKLSQPEAGSNPPIFEEICRTINNHSDNRNPTCKYCGSSVHFEIEKNCDTLNNCDVCELARSYKRAYAKKKGGTSFFSIGLIPQIANQVLFDSAPLRRSAISYLLLKGDILDSVRDTIMKYFSNICVT